MFSRLDPKKALRAGAIVAVAGTGAFCALDLMFGSEKFYKELVMPVVHKCVDAESAHNWAVKLCSHRILPPFGQNYLEYKRLKTAVWGVPFVNPIGLAAGFDKDGVALPGTTRIGFGFVEIGSVTPQPQPGNERPRLFRLPEDSAVINSYGFNSEGHDVVRGRLADFLLSHHSCPVKIGVNLGKNKESKNPAVDFVSGVEKLGSFCDYLVVNVSSPNTPGLRDLQHKKELETLMAQVNEARGKLDHKTILLLKVAPDLTAQQQKDIADLCLNRKFDISGLIVTNTTLSRPDSLVSDLKDKPGGLSGKPLAKLATDCVRNFYSLTGGQVPIVGCGGISSGEDAYEKIRAGASLVQLYTSLVYQGFPVVGKVKRELDALLKRDGFESVSEAVGIDHKKLSSSKN